MRISHPQQGDDRVIVRFLLMPRRIGAETRWLERARIYQVFGGAFFGWMDFRWEDDAP